MSSKANAAYQKFQKIKALRAAGAHVACTRMSDSWTKRKSNNVKGFYNAKEAKR